MLQVFQNPNAAYLKSNDVNTDDIASPLNMGLENSRRFRALPVYATLVSLGRDGLQQMFTRQVRLARRIAALLDAHDEYELLAADKSRPGSTQHVHIIVLFRARDDVVNAKLVPRIIAGRQIYVSGTSWEGRPAARFAISTWQIDEDSDLERIRGALDEALRV